MSKTRSKVDEKLSNFKEAVKLAALDNSAVEQIRSPFHAKHALNHTPTANEKMNGLQLSNVKKSATPAGTTQISKFCTPN
jgi:hypothetical protein